MIFTLDGRDNVFLEVIKSHFNLSYDQLFSEINASFEGCLIELGKLNVNYVDLKNALIPNPTKREVGLVFDSRKVGSDSYGYAIFEALIPLLEKKGTCSVLCGDLIGNNSHYSFIRSEFLGRINSKVEIDYVHHDHFFIVYLNNSSDFQIESFEKSLASFPSYVGYFDMTYSSPLKTYLSMILIKHFIKCGNIILTTDEDTRLDFNFHSYSFEELGYRCHTVADIYYRLFLSFKIERELIVQIDSDNEFSLSSITGDVLDINNFELVIEDAKLSYLLDAKKDSMERSGFHSMNVSDLQKLIKSKLLLNYLYNLDYNKTHGVLKFNINIETPRTDKEAPMKMVVSLEYKPKERVLRLITMY